MGLSFDYVIPKFDTTENKWKPWDTVNLNYPCGVKFWEKSDCQKYCDEQNVVWYDNNHNIIFKRSQWKNWDAVNSIAKILLEDDIDGVPYIDSALKKNILPNLFTRLSYLRDRFSDEEYSKYYQTLSEECL